MARNYGSGALNAAHIDLETTSIGYDIADQIDDERRIDETR
jgi:hypothetical protein